MSGILIKLMKNIIEELNNKICILNNSKNSNLKNMNKDLKKIIIMEKY